ncbi:uncharacterized protein LOC128548129 [Mercenaria mercenaria]|uniref:uncharacterized protein LOC128548129 n=1 Tax=Mercenaria mercenaria TaxID=6596 RepID=UPI00234ECDB9|nr:uncharacterized protein LOC128548129 [Mercenaria mercenaria]
MGSKNRSVIEEFCDFEPNPNLPGPEREVLLPSEFESFHSNSTSSLQNKEGAHDTQHEKEIDEFEEFVNSKYEEHCSSSEYSCPPGPIGPPVGSVEENIGNSFTNQANQSTDNSVPKSYSFENNSSQLFHSWFGQSPNVSHPGSTHVTEINQLAHTSSSSNANIPGLDRISELCRLRNEQTNALFSNSNGGELQADRSESKYGPYEKKNGSKPHVTVGTVSSTQPFKPQGNLMIIENTSTPSVKPELSIPKDNFKPQSHDDFKPLSHDDLKPRSHSGHQGDFKPWSHDNSSGDFQSEFKRRSHGDLKPQLHSGYQGDLKPWSHGNFSDGAQNEFKPLSHDGLRPLSHNDISDKLRSPLFDINPQLRSDSQSQHTLAHAQLKNVQFSYQNSTVGQVSNHSAQPVYTTPNSAQPTYLASRNQRPTSVHFAYPGSSNMQDSSADSRGISTTSISHYINPTFHSSMPQPAYHAFAQTIPQTVVQSFPANVPATHTTTALPGYPAPVLSAPTNVPASHTTTALPGYPAPVLSAPTNVPASHTTTALPSYPAPVLSAPTNVPASHTTTALPGHPASVWLALTTVPSQYPAVSQPAPSTVQLPYPTTVHSGYPVAVPLAPTVPLGYPVTTTVCSTITSIPSGYPSAAQQAHLSAQQPISTSVPPGYPGTAHLAPPYPVSGHHTLSGITRPMINAHSLQSAVTQTSFLPYPPSNLSSVAPAITQLPYPTSVHSAFPASVHPGGPPSISSAYPSTMPSVLPVTTQLSFPTPVHSVYPMYSQEGLPPISRCTQLRHLHYLS